MLYLLAKYAVLFLLSALFGIALGYWYSRRKFVDVTESYVDLRTANARSDATQWDQLWNRLDAMPTHQETDLTNVYERIAGVTSAVSNLPRPEPVSLTSVEERLDNLDGSVRALPVPEMPAPVDLTPVNQRLTAIEEELGNLGQQFPKRATTERTPRNEGRSEPRILSGALYGKKDDLKLISGVGPKLEGLLNRNGIFYFWQVAEWSARDINIIDERLDAFKGRIARDNWVSQAKQLQRTPGAASMPAE